jgi:hypothetical protein
MFFLVGHGGSGESVSGEGRYRRLTVREIRLRWFTGEVIR